MRQGISWYFWQRPFLVSLAIFSLIVGLPLCGFAFWWGVNVAIAGNAEALRAMQCPVPWDRELDRMRAEEIALRNRASELDSTIAGRRATCQICPPEGSVDVALVIDTSLSMQWPASMDAETERTRMEEIDRIGRTAPGGVNAALRRALAQTPPGQERMEAARQAVLTAIETLPNRARIHLFAFENSEQTGNSCRVSSLGNFDSSARAPLRTAVAGLRPNALGTPLASAIEAAAAAVRNRPSNVPGSIIIVTDGAESCRGDPCAAAQAVRSADPGLSITVLDIANNRHVSCLAAATGGRVLSPGGGAGVEIARQLQEALTPSAPAICIPRPTN